MMDLVVFGGFVGMLMLLLPLCAICDRCFDRFDASKEIRNSFGVFVSLCFFGDMFGLFTVVIHGFVNVSASDI